MQCIYTPYAISPRGPVHGDRDEWVWGLRGAVETIWTMMMNSTTARKEVMIYGHTYDF